MYRQGDILIVAVDEAVVTEAEAKPEIQHAVRQHGKLILAYGESTGHAHAIGDPRVDMLDFHDSRYLRSTTAFTLVHEEHAPIQIPAGTYRVIRQREYLPTAMQFSRVIAD